MPRAAAVTGATADPGGLSQRPRIGDRARWSEGHTRERAGGPTAADDLRRDLTRAMR
jgi:hypothetical protein